MREIACMMLEEFKKELPGIFGDIGTEGATDGR